MITPQMKLNIVKTFGQIEELHPVLLHQNII